MTSYVIDIEAVPYQPVYDAWKANNKDKDFVPAFACKIVTLGYAKLSPSFSLEKLGVACVNETEKEGLEVFSAAVTTNAASLVTWNGRSYDLPLISYRCLHYGIPLTWYHEERSEYRNRYKTTKHFDMLDYISDYGQTRPSLDYIARLVGLPGKMDAKGSEVEQMYNDGKIDEIVSYCTTDVLQEYILLLRIMLTRGTISKTHYKNLVETTFNSIQAEGNLELSAQIPNKTLLSNSIEKASTLAIAKGCRTLLNNWDHKQALEV